MTRLNISANDIAYRTSGNQNNYEGSHAFETFEIFRVFGVKDEAKPFQGAFSF